MSAPTLPLPPPIFDTPVEAFGVGVKKVQKVIMDERHVLMNADIFRRVIELPYDDPRRKAPLEILYNEFATNLLTGLPVQGVLFKPAKWKELELELIQTQMAQKPMLRAEVGMRVRCANKASAE